jgi:hypothetical protein
MTPKPSDTVSAALIKERKIALALLRGERANAHMHSNDGYRNTHRMLRLLVLSNEEKTSCTNWLFLSNALSCYCSSFPITGQNLHFLYSPVENSELIKATLECAIENKEPFDLIMVSEKDEWKKIQNIIEELPEPKPVLILTYDSKHHNPPVRAKKTGLPFITKYMLNKAGTDDVRPLEEAIKSALGNERINNLAIGVNSGNLSTMDYLDNGNTIMTFRMSDATRSGMHRG